MPGSHIVRNLKSLTSTCNLKRWEPPELGIVLFSIISLANAASKALVLSFLLLMLVPLVVFPLLPFVVVVVISEGGASSILQKYKTQNTQNAKTTKNRLPTDNKIRHRPANRPICTRKTRWKHLSFFCEKLHRPRFAQFVSQKLVALWLQVSYYFLLVSY